MVSSQIQPRLISLDSPEIQAQLELFPGVWKAAERLGSQDVKERHSALDELLQTDAPRVLPLVAYIFVTRIFDPNLKIRVRIVEALANVMRRDTEGKYAVDEVRSQIISGLSDFGETGIVAMLELGVNEENLTRHISKLLNFSRNAGKILKQIAADRTKNLEIRRLAIYFIGKMGYVDAASELERIRNRLEARQEGQKRMPFAPEQITDAEESLLPEIQKTIKILRLTE